jgi:hypothetical protein
MMVLSLVGSRLMYEQIHVNRQHQLLSVTSVSSCDFPGPFNFIILKRPRGIEQRQEVRQLQGRRRRQEYNDKENTDQLIISHVTPFQTFLVN